ncbi:hypothetical protein CHS0354_014390 [Potamilus streckersoni]|uniref:Uncharacterized protein n=1 Tax=Potamilus streckersoni TaxID=2493646 RepID=A0AAE0VSA4_9BIVA|nr:hypothetical protein CHS0354_014390 [Potamilus streckersoni]
MKSPKEMIKVTCTSDICQNVSSMVNSFLKTIQSNCHKLDYFVKHHQAAMKETFKEDILQITRKSEIEIRVYGTGQAITDVRRVIDNLNIVIVVSWVARQNVIEFLQREEGNQLLNKLESKQNSNSRLCVKITQRTLCVKVDVIVDSAAPDLKLDKGEVAKCLNRAAGTALQQDILR